MLKVLIVDDQPAVRMALETLFEVHGLPVVAVATPAEALDLIASEDVGAVVQDMNFTQESTTGEEGMALFRSIKALDPDLPVLLVTAWTSLESAVTLVKEGAADYMAKPWDDEKLVRSVRTLVEMRALRQDNVRLRARSNRARRQLAARHDLRGLVYASDAMHAAINLAVAVAPSDAPVLVTGPNGSGKELVAEIIQASSRRRERPFVKVNVGALPDNLLEAELFGAEAGAFTGASKLRVGRFEAADGGTLFLDEIGNLSMAGQAKLLRVLQTGEFERLGSSATRKVDVRIVSATNADLAKAIAAGTFREDLYFRLNVIELHVPPLCERLDDVVPLAEHFLALHNRDREQAGQPPARLGDAARALLGSYEWPGNVRELQNRIQRAVLVCQDALISAEDLGIAPSALGAASCATASRGARPAPAAPAAIAASGGEMETIDRATIEEALARAGGVVARAAAELGLSRQAFYRRMERLGVALERRSR